MVTVRIRNKKITGSLKRLFNLEPALDPRRNKNSSNGELDTLVSTTAITTMRLSLIAYFSPLWGFSRRKRSQRTRSIHLLFWHMFAQLSKFHLQKQLISQMASRFQSVMLFIFTKILFSPSFSDASYVQQVSQAEIISAIVRYYYCISYLNANICVALISFSVRFKRPSRAYNINYDITPVNVNVKQLRPPVKTNRFHSCYSSHESI